MIRWVSENTERGLGRCVDVGMRTGGVAVICDYAAVEPSGDAGVGAAGN